MLIIETEEKLKEQVKNLRYEKVLGIDTEFVRRDTYFAKLCLIQVSTARDSFIIDPIKCDVSEFKNILENENIIKIFHAPYQDLGIFYNDLKATTKNIFDTQEAARFADIKNQISYQELCSKVIGVNIVKTQKFREWNLRPIPEDMIEYAAQDVKYLIPLYNKLKDLLKSKQRYEVFRSKMAELNSPESYNNDLEDAWIRIKTDEKSPKFIENLKILAHFREESVIELDIPRQYFLSDNELILIAKSLPQTEKELARLCLRRIPQDKFKTKLLEICSGLREL